MHILIVDDVTDNIQVAMNILKEDGYSFSFATQGSEAINLIESDFQQISLILLDIMMPGIDGFAVCKKIKANPLTAQIPVIFLTAKTDIDTMRTGFLLGAVDYITKPFHADELLARVKTHTQLYQAKKVLQQNNLALTTMVQFEHKRLISELEDNQKEMIFVLTELMEATSDETGQHIRRVAELSALLAHYHPALTEDDVEILRYASPMHDVGKITIPHDLLHKQGRYTEEEFVQMKAHTTNAHKLLSTSNRKFMNAAAIIAHEHHEKWNGKGYPRGLKGEKIHIYGRIVAVADVFDALMHKRCYKEAWGIDETVTYIKDHDGTQFDPQLIDIFMTHLDEFIAIAKIT